MVCMEAKPRSRQVGAQGGGKHARGGGKKMAGLGHWLWIGPCLRLRWPMSIYSELLACQMNQVLLAY